MTTDKRAAALAWAARGFKVFPLVPGTKRPIDLRWYDVAADDPVRIHAMWTDPVMGWLRDYNIGVLTDDLIVIDIDVKNGKDGWGSYFDLGLPLDTLTVGTPSGGAHAYFSGPSRSLSVNRLGPGLDVRSFHGYVVAPGSELDVSDPRNSGVGGLYTIQCDKLIQAVPPNLLALLDAPIERHDQASAVDLDSNAAIERAAYYLDHDAPLAVEGAGGDHTTYRVAARLKDFGVSSDVAASMLVERWNERCAPPWPLDELKAKVDNAYHYGKLPPGSADPALDYQGVNIEAVPDPAFVGGDFYYHGDPWDTDTRWLYLDTLPATGVVVLAAPSKAGKTFVALDLADSLAAFRPFFGIMPEEAGATIYLTSESLRSIKVRLSALSRDARLPIAVKYASGLGVKGALQTLLEMVQRECFEILKRFQVPVRLIVLDTLSASGLLTNENDNALTAEALSALNRASQALNALFLVCHHPAKEGRGMRGAGAIEGSADYVMEIIHDKRSKVREITLDKARDAETRSLGGFTLVPQTVGVDGRGRNIVTCTVSTGEAVPAKAEKDMTGVALFLVECLELRMITEGGMVEGHQCVELEAVKDEFEERYSGSRERTAIRKAWSRGLAMVTETGAVERVPFGGRTYLTMKQVIQ